MKENNSTCFAASRRPSTVSGLVARWKPQVVSGFAALMLAAGVGLAPSETHAALVTLDTTSLMGFHATLEFTLFDGDGVVGNNSVTISSLATNGTLLAPTCPIGCSGGPPYVLDDTGLSQFLQDLTLGTSLMFDISFTRNFNGMNAPDRLSLSLLETSTSLSFVNTNLDLSGPVPVQDALLIADLAPGTGLGLVLASSTDPQIGITAVPAPGALALLATGLLLLPGRRHRKNN